MDYNQVIVFNLYLMDRNPIPPEWWGDRDRHRSEIVLMHKKLAQKVAHNFSNKVPIAIRLHKFDEYLSVAYDGMLKAIDKYDLSLGYQFSTFCQHKMNGEILHFIRDTSSMPRQWIEDYELVQRTHKAMNAARLNRGIQPLSLAEIAKKLKISEWREIYQMMSHPNPTDLGNHEFDACMAVDSGIDRSVFVRRCLLRMNAIDRMILEDYMIALDKGITYENPRLLEVQELFKILYEAIDGNSD
jgi:hypothetical protein